MESSTGTLIGFLEANLIVVIVLVGAILCLLALYFATGRARPREPLGSRNERRAPEPAPALGTFRRDRQSREAPTGQTNTQDAKRIARKVVMLVVLGLIVIWTAVVLMTLAR